MGKKGIKLESEAERNRRWTRFLSLSPVGKVQSPVGKSLQWNLERVIRFDKTVKSSSKDIRTKIVII